VSGDPTRDPSGASAPEPQADDDLDELIHRADLDGLVRLVDARTASRDWPGLLRTRDRARHALRTGRQLWPVATLAEYRLALWAPAEWACRVLDEESGRFTIGPLTEVVAQHHTFAELSPHLPPGPRVGFVAHERAARGEAIAQDLDSILALIDARQRWEPVPPLATYSDDGVDAPSPPLPSPTGFTARTRGRRPGATTPTVVDDASMTGDLQGSVTLNLTFTGQLQANANDPKIVERKPGTTHITGTATSGSATYSVDVTR